MTKNTSQVLAASFILLCLPLHAQAKRPRQEPPEEVDLSWGLKVPMSDGVNLNATIYRPKDEKQPLPVIFALTPYITDSDHRRAYYFAQHGYVFATVDSRGHGNSEAHFDPLMQEPQDSYEVVEWLARQPWSNGKVTMWGASYLGFDQWMTLREFPTHLATPVTVAVAYAGVDFPMFKNIWAPSDIQFLTFTGGGTSHLHKTHQMDPCDSSTRKAAASPFAGQPMPESFADSRGIVRP
jgi:putative CocE/NonD family hydrolase